jgi:hypothetical protein
MIPTLLPSLERHGRFRLDQADRGLVLGVSAATIDRLMVETKSARPAVDAGSIKLPNERANYPVAAWGPSSRAKHLARVQLRLVRTNPEVGVRPPDGHDTAGATGSSFAPRATIGAPDGLLRHCSG